MDLAAVPWAVIVADQALGAAEIAAKFGEMVS